MAAHQSFLPPPLAQSARLTAREGQVLQAITDGLNNSEIAAVLHISMQTVKSHVKAILHKLQARDRTQAVVIALRAGVVILPAALASPSPTPAPQAAG